jgi:hypothetical protein
MRYSSSRFVPLGTPSKRLNLLAAKTPQPMDDLTARLEAILRRYAVACREGQLDDAQLAKRFRVDLQTLIAAYGFDAVEAALDAIPDAASPSAFLH